ncbi:MAG: glycerophosphodiester phosphodiesterase family protein [Verrucomicrobiota bacterium]
MITDAFSSGPIIIAHRGACAVAPENTCSAIEKAIEMGVKVIEFDVRETSDGVLVLFHDKDLRRLLDRKDSIETLTWNEAKELDVGGWFGKEEFEGEKPMSLKGAIQLCVEHEVTPLIEHKTGAAINYATVLERLDVVDQVIVQSFSWTFLSEIRRELPELKIGALGKRTLDRSKLGQLAELKPDWVGWNFKDLTTTGLKTLKREGFLVALWTVNDPKVVNQWIERGVDGIITDHPDKMLKLLD